MARVGDVIGERFSLEREVAVGGMGRVFQARDSRTDESVAVKLLVDTRPRSTQRFAAECAVLAEIQHPGVVRYIAHGSDGADLSYLVMEWLDGVDLGQYLRSRTAAEPNAAGRDADQDTEALASHLWQETVDTVTLEPVTTLSNPDVVNMRIRPGVISEPLPETQVRRLGLQLAAAVTELHRRHFIHCDIKPANLFLTQSDLDRVTLIDFGTVVSYRNDRSVSHQGRLLGTPHYMAPEQARTTERLTPATDIWAIGCVLYQCLVGMRPFQGTDMLTVLSRIVMETPPPVHELRPDVTPALSELIMWMLAKAPASRPASASALASYLEQLDSDLKRPRLAFSSQPDLGGAATRAHSEQDYQVTSMLFIDATHIAASAKTRLQRLLYPHRKRLQRLADGTRIVTHAEARSPADQAAATARLALKLRATLADLVQVLVTGHASGPRDRPAALGSVLDSAARALRDAAPGAIQLDSLTASLLDTRFYVHAQPGGAHLHCERPRPISRTLLGKPVRMVGRERELARLAQAVERCARESTRRTILVTGGAGVGKSRLCREFVTILHNRPLTYLVASGQTSVTDSPFSMLAPSIRRAADILDDEPLSVRRDKIRRLVARVGITDDASRVSAFLGQLARVPMPADEHPLLPDAHRDPQLMGRLMSRAWDVWVAAACANQRLVMVLDDVHGGDPASLRYIARALDASGDRPLLVVAYARPEDGAADSALWRHPGHEDWTLAPLTADASRHMCHQVLRRRVPEEQLDAIIAASGGRVQELEERIRALSQGAAQETAPLSQQLQRRLETLAPEAKRLLRAASIFGLRFWRDGVRALLGDTGVADLVQGLDDLVLSELVQRCPASCLPGEVEYEFRSDAVQRAAYQLLVERDRRLGHRLAGAWLEHLYEADPVVLAEHFARAQEPVRAVPHYRRAAYASLVSDNWQTAISQAERAVALGAAGEELGRARATQALAHFHVNDYQSCIQAGREALEHLTPGSGRWLEAGTHAMVASQRSGASEQARQLLERLTEQPPAPDAHTSLAVTRSLGVALLLDQNDSERALTASAGLSAREERDGQPTRATGVRHNALALMAIHRTDWSQAAEHARAAARAFAYLADDHRAQQSMRAHRQLAEIEMARVRADGDHNVEIETVVSWLYVA